MRKSLLRIMAAVAVCASLASAWVASPALGDDDFPIAGTYLQNEACKGDGADRPELRVRITRKDIVSSMGICTILHVKREGPAFGAQVECKVPSGHLILGDVMFTPRPDGALDFDDQDHTSSAVLHRCGQ
jgi:hypothetical protein